MICSITFSSAAALSAEARTRFEQEGAVFTQPDPATYPDLWAAEPFTMEFITLDELAEWLRKMGEDAIVSGDGSIEIYNWYRE